MRIVFVGAGRLATQLAHALHGQGHDILAVYSRTMEGAEALCRIVGGQATNEIAALPMSADAFIVAVKDDVLTEVIAQLAPGREGCPFYHTAGSVPMSVFGGHPHHGVIYPMQTFSKERMVDFRSIPVFIEASSELALQRAETLARTVSDNVRMLSGEKRRYLHLAAVFACNFANHCYALAADVLERHGLDFDVMIPLIEETARKVGTMHPRDAQTGPAVRFDENVIHSQEQLLADNPLVQEVYRLMSRSIHLSCLV